MPLTAKALKDTALPQLFTASMWRSQFKCQFLWEELPDHPRKSSEYLCISTSSSSQPLPFPLSWAPLQQGPYRSGSPLSPWPQHSSDPGEDMRSECTHSYKYSTDIYILMWIFKIKLENPMMSWLAVPQTRSPHTLCEMFARLSAPRGNSAWEVLG